MSILERCFDWLRDAFRAAARRQWKAALDARDLVSAGSQAADSALRDARRALDAGRKSDLDHFPASVALVRHYSLTDAVRRGDLKRIRCDVEAARQHLLRRKAGWDDQSAGAAVGAAIGSLLRDGKCSDAELREALDLFAAFRRECSAPVPEAFAMTALLARRGAAGGDAVRAYAEYLLCLGDAAPAEELAKVSEAMQAACRPGRPDAEDLNEMVARTCGCLWAEANLAEICYRRKDYHEAQRHVERAQVAGKTARLRYLAGLIHRGLENWPAAAYEFEQFAQASQAGTGEERVAQSFAIEARFRECDGRLAAGRWKGPPPETKWREWHDALVAMLRGGGPAGGEGAEARAVALEVLLELDRRLGGPRARLVRLVEMEGDCPRTDGDLAELLFESSPAVDDGLLAILAPAAGARPENVAAAHRLLVQGRISRLPDVLGPVSLSNGQPTRGPALVLLRADYKIRVGDLSEARTLLWQRNWLKSRWPDRAVRLRAECLIAEGHADDALRLLRSDDSAWLGPADRGMLLAEAHEAAGDWQSAQVQFDALPAEARDTPRVLVPEGFILLRLGQDEAAFECFVRALGCERHHCYAQLGRGLSSGDLCQVAGELVRQEPGIGQLVPPLAARLSRAGRTDLVAQLAAAGFSIHAHGNTGRP